MAHKLYVGNLSWGTTEASLSEAFAQAGTVVSASIPLTSMGKSRGFGFVEMESAEEAEAAIQMWNGKELDGRELRVNEAGQAPAGGTVNNAKLFVGSLAWSTTEDGLRDAFSQAGTVVSAAIPLNEQGKSRGIGFVQMGSEEEAQAAIEMWNGKELDGRSLVVNVARPPMKRERRDREDGGYSRGGYDRHSSY